MNSALIRLNPPQKSLRHEVRIPGSKSYTNRALILAAMAKGDSVLKFPSFSDDSKVLIEALKKLGVEFVEEKDSIRVKGRAGKFLPYKGEINVGPAGTAMRFLVSLCSLIEGAEIVLSGSERMHQRPIHDLVDALIAMGVRIEYLGTPGCPPLKIYGSGAINGGTVKICGTLSSQYFSSLLMVGPLLRDGLVIQVDGQQISRSYIDMTFDSLSAFGIMSKNNTYESYYVKGSELPKAIEYQIEGDVSGASYFWGMAAISGAAIKVVNVNPNSSQGDIKFPTLLEKMGCKVLSGFNGPEGWIKVTGTKKLKGIHTDMKLMPDTAQTLAVVASFAETETHLTGLSTLRIKETDRIEALQNELKTLGIQTESEEASLKVLPGKIHSGRIQTYDDHRMAMSFAMLGTVLSDIEIEHPNVVTKSFPEFWDLISSLGVQTEYIE